MFKLNFRYLLFYMKPDAVGIIKSGIKDHPIQAHKTSRNTYVLHVTPFKHG